MTFVCAIPTLTYVGFISFILLYLILSLSYPFQGILLQKHHLSGEDTFCRGDLFLRFVREKLLHVDLNTTCRSAIPVFSIPHVSLVYNHGRNSVHQKSPHSYP